MGDYPAFLASKNPVAPAVGFEISPGSLNPALFPFQRDIVAWALGKGRAGLLCDTGTGKTAMQVEWARRVHEETGGDVLILAPLAVGAQTVREGDKFGVEVTRCKTADDVRPGVNVANYERLEAFDPSAFAGVVLDECFAPDTEIDTPVGRKRIQDVKIGDKIINAAGVDTVADVHRREVPYGVRITANGRRILSSPNHPYFTRCGWVGAQDLKPGDEILATSSAMRMVREDFHGWLRASREDEILRSILLSEMADEPAGAQGEGTYAGSSQKTRREEERLVQVGVAEGGSRVGADTQLEPDEGPGGSEEDLPPIESDAPRTFRAWGERAWFDEASTDATGCARTELGGGVCFVAGETDSRLSHALQARLSESRAKSRYRGGWELPPQSQGSRPQERREAGFVRVDSLEVLEPGHRDLDRLRDADGKLYFYDLGATRHPSFSVNSLLVHNSSILKAFMGKTKRSLVEAFADTRFKLACTATPAPNDHLELGNHAEFLGAMHSTEMIARWFINDTMHMGSYRLKHHAERDFWRWVSSWAVALRKPSDLGYPDAGFDLPPLLMHEVVVPVDRTIDSGDRLIRDVSMSATEMHREMRLTARARTDRAAELVNESDEAWALWCNTNHEADLLKAKIFDAVEVRGSDSAEEKEAKLLAFSRGEVRVMITKPSIAGFGLNWQHCRNTAFVGLSHSFEQFYQAVRRLYRYGQSREVRAYVVIAETEGGVLDNIRRKMAAHEALLDGMRDAMAGSGLSRSARLSLTAYEPGEEMKIPKWLAPLPSERRSA